MIEGVLSRLKKDPLGFLRRVFYKLIVGPLRYRRGAGYDAERYWRDRFQKYGISFKAVGHEGLTEEENRAAYSEAARVFLDLCRDERIDRASARVLEIGCGMGFYTHFLSKAGVSDYEGLDITDVFFPSLSSDFPNYRFRKLDVTADHIDGEYDLVVMIDVTEHIVEDDKLTFAMDNLRRCLSRNGVVLLAQPSLSPSEKNLFYLRFWSLEDIKRRFSGYTFGEPVPFREGYLVSIRPARSSGETPPASEA